jgi:hypothetical protein
VVTIYFITNLSITPKQHDSIMAVVDKLTKETHFIPVNTTHKDTHIAKVYTKEVVRLHRVPKEIVLYIDSNFKSKFWQGFFKVSGTNLNLSTTYYPESYGKIERTNTCSRCTKMG